MLAHISRLIEVVQIVGKLPSSGSWRRIVDLKPRLTVGQITKPFLSHYLSNARNDEEKFKIEIYSFTSLIHR